MPDAKIMPPSLRFRSSKKQAGVAAVEFALLVLIFFTFVFGVLEIARVVYLFNTLQEVTRRAAAAAAVSDFAQGTVDQIRANALFLDKNGKLVLGAPVTPSHLKIEYLSLSRDSVTGTLTMYPVPVFPSSPARNRLNCLADPYGSSCIRFVRVQVCVPDASLSCSPVPYQPLFPLINLSSTLPRSATIVPVESLGYTLGDMP
jgi:hypothetical protein